MQMDKRKEAGHDRYSDDCHVRYLSDDRLPEEGKGSRGDFGGSTGSRHRFAAPDAHHGSRF
jgi:hypothetical protein